MEDISNIIKELSDIFSSNDIPDNLKDVINNINNSEPSQTITENNDNSSISMNNTAKGDNNNDNFNIDIDMIFKLKKVFDEINRNDDPRKSLLISLKPYLKDNKKSKIDKYIQFLNIAKIIEVIGPDILGSDKNAWFWLYIVY